MPVALHLFADKAVHSFHETRDFLAARCDVEPETEDVQSIKLQRSFSIRVTKTWTGLETFGLTHTVHAQAARITDFGEQVIAENPRQITAYYLEKFPQFRASEYYELREVRRRAAMDTEAAAGPKLSTAPQTPTDSGLVRSPRDVVVWFGTNRKPVTVGNFEKGFTAARDTHVNFGRTIVNIPEGHRLGGKRMGILCRWLKGTPGLVLRKIESLPEADFWSLLRQELRPEVEENSLLLFLHGFWQTFEQAAIRTAQLKYDLKMPCAAFYSWPSHGSPFRYTADSTNAAASAPYIARFLRRLAEVASARQVRLHIVAHSMGNHALLIALEKLLSSLKGAKPAFTIANLVFAAADVDQDIFVNSVSSTTALANRRTLYASGEDRALRKSGHKHKMPRAGFLPPVTIEKHTETIEVPNFDFNDLGHGYYANAGLVLHDMFELLHHGTKISQRQGIHARKDSAGQYWRLM